MALTVLSALDTARTQYYHFKAIIIAGMGLFTDAYDLFCITPVMILIGNLYYNEDNPDEQKRGVTPPFVGSITLGIALLGTVMGQLLFGWLGDRMGRKRVYGLALILMVSSSIGCGFSICRTRKCVLTSLCFFRFWLGVGIGGDYPLSATIMSEFANKKTRGSFIAAVFSMQGFGILASSAVTMVVCSIFDRSSNATKNFTPEVTDLAWRLILMFGAIPAVMTYYWRMMMPETARYTALVEQNVRQAVKDMEKVLDMATVNQITEDADILPNLPSYGLLSKQFFFHHGRDLFSCATSWFLVDIAFYSSNLFQSKIYKNHLPAHGTVNAYKEAFRTAELQAIIGICSTIPGYWATVYFIDRIGRVKIQAIGFLCMAICMFAIGLPYNDYWKENPNVLFLILYASTFFFSNFGPNTTTFIVPAELFPARFRSTCHGISGAAGKVGAIIGSVGVLWASQYDHEGKAGPAEPDHHKGNGMASALVILGGICVLGMCITLFFTPETMGKSLEDNEIDEESNDARLLRCFKNSSDLSHTSLSAVVVVAAS